MTPLDIGLFIGICVFVFLGMTRGISKILLGFTGWVIAAIVAFVFSSQLAPSIADALPNMKQISLVIAFVFLVVAVRIGCYIIVLLLKKVLGLDKKASLDKLLGGLVGLAQGVILVSFLCFGFTLLPLSEELQTMEKKSVFYPQMIEFSTLIVENFSRVMPESKKTVDKIMKKFKNKTIDKIRDDVIDTVENELDELSPEDAARIYEKEKKRLEKIEKDVRRK
ncbi:CvpA family protein [candidate division KSB1 bacterium]|nr:CvpA family protein [candidate division KSB1 bacterium]